VRVVLAAALFLAFLGCHHNEAAPEVSPDRIVQGLDTAPPGDVAAAPRFQQVALGQQVVVDGGTATVFRYQTYTHSGDCGDCTPPPSFTFGQIDAQLCADNPPDGTLMADSGSFAIEMADHERPDLAGFKPTGTAFADTTLSNGQCVRGWINFNVPADQKALVALYAPAGGETQAEWTLP